MRIHASSLVAVLGLLLTLAALHSASAQTNTLSSPDWTITATPGTLSQVSGGATTITVVVDTLNTVYNLGVTVTAQDLTITNDQSSGNSFSWSQLNQGDSRQVVFTLTIPTSAVVGNQYNLTVEAQSYSTSPGPFGVRSPLDHPSATSQTSFLLQVVPVPALPTSGGGGASSTPLVVAAVVGVLVVAVFYMSRRGSYSGI